jgi:dolichol-phosphate mannosyltransferase
MTSVSVVIPTFNESENIVRVIEGVRKASPDYNIIVVDDSDDDKRTHILAVANGAKVIEGQHKGLGQAIIDGIKVSDSDVVVVMDADLSHPPAKIPELVSACNNGCNMAVGSRYAKGGSIIGWTLKRRIISLVASIIAYPISRIHDNTSGFFAVSRNQLDGVGIKPDSWKIMLEVLIKTGAKVKEIPIEFKDREAGQSKFNRKEVFAYLKHLFKLALYKYQVFNFMIVGGLGYIINMSLYYPLILVFQPDTTFLGQHFYLPPFIISSFVAISFNYNLNKRWTFHRYHTNSLGYFRYLSMAFLTVLLDIILLFVFVDFGKMYPIAAAALAIAIAFVLRYLIAKTWIWRKIKVNIS